MGRGRFLYQRLEEVAKGRRKAGFGLVGSAKWLGGWFWFGIVLVLSGLVCLEVFVGTFSVRVFTIHGFLWSNTSFTTFFHLHTFGESFTHERTPLLAMDVMSWWGIPIDTGFANSLKEHCLFVIHSY